MDQINNRIAEDNQELVHGATTIVEPVIRYFEVIKTSLSDDENMVWWCNNCKLENGTLFESDRELMPSSIDGITYWVSPSVLPNTGMSTIGYELCNELDLDTYNAKSTISPDKVLKG